jgi:hypothetical protein
MLQPRLPSYSQVLFAAHLTRISDGSFNYQSDIEFTGSDSFSYLTNDGTEDSVTASTALSPQIVSPHLLMQAENVGGLNNMWLLSPSEPGSR